MDDVTKSEYQYPERKRGREAKIEELLRRVDTLPVLDDRTEDEILGYDENGLPT